MNTGAISDIYKLYCYFLCDNAIALLGGKDKKEKDGNVIVKRWHICINQLFKYIQGVPEKTTFKDF